MNLFDVRSNQALYEQLAGAAAGGRLCHAYLFLGPEGIGKRTLARSFAAAVLCRRSGKGEPVPCGECGSCKKLLSNSHPDFYCYEGRRGANAIHIDTVRGIRQDAYIRPNDGEYKVYLIPHAEDFSIGAANALLKVLEEPPRHAVFLLTAGNKNAVPETIRSRCIQLELYPMPEPALAAALEELAPQADADRRQMALRRSGGNLGRALELLNSENADDLSRLCARIGEGICRMQEYEILTAMTEAASGKDSAAAKEQLGQVLRQLSQWIREAMLERLAPGSGAGKLAEELAVRLSLYQLEQVQLFIEEARRGLSGNANTGLLANYFTAGLMALL